MAAFEDRQALNVATERTAWAAPSPRPRDLAYCLRIDAGEPGETQSSAKTTGRDRVGELVERAIVTVSGLEAVRLGGFRIDCVVLLRPHDKAEPGTVVT